MEIKANVGLLPEDMNLYERLTGEEYLHFAGRMYRLPEEEVVARTTRWVRHNGLSRIAAAPSGGAW